MRSLAVSRCSTRRIVVLTVAASLLASGCGRSPATSTASRPLTVFAAASLTDAIGEIAADYQARTGQRLQLSFGASGAVARQIQAGAPADVVLLADPAWMDRLEATGLIAPGSRSDLVTNRLVVIAAVDTAVSEEPFAWLERNRLKLVIGDPNSVPAGAYAQAWLQRIGRWDGLQGQIATAADVRAVRTFVDRGEAGLGIVYFSDTVGDPAIRVVAEPAAADRPDIVYPAAATRAAGPGAARFLAFLHSAEARRILRAHGFSVAGQTGQQ